MLKLLSFLKHLEDIHCIGGNVVDPGELEDEHHGEAHEEGGPVPPLHQETEMVAQLIQHCGSELMASLYTHLNIVIMIYLVLYMF